MKYIAFFIFFSCFFIFTKSCLAQDTDKLLVKYNQLQKELRESQNYKPPKNQPKRKPTTPQLKAPREVRVIKQDMTKTALALADAYLQEPNFREAIYFYNETSRIGEEVGDLSTAALAQRKLGDHHTKYDNYPSAIKSYVDASKFYQKARKYDIYIEVLTKIARLHIGKKENKKAINALLRTLQEAELYKEFKKMTECYELLAQVYNAEGDAENAKYYSRLSKGTKDVIANSETAIKEKETAMQQVEQLDKKQDLIEAKLNSGNLSSEESEQLKKQIAELESKKTEAEHRIKRQDENLKRKLKELEQKNTELQETQEDLKDSQELIEKKQQQLQLLTAGGLLLLVVIVVIVVSAVSVRKANRKLAAQNAEILKQAREIEQQKAVIEEEKEKSDKLLLNILPQATADELKTKGYAVPKHYDQVSVMFGDIKGFTNIAEKLTPREVIEELNTCFSTFDAICEKYGLERIKTIGDAYMCAGGIPTENATNALDAVLAALEMQQFMKEVKARKEILGEPYFELRIGIHTGAVIAGVVGTKKFAYDIWGDTVNLASRMESSGEVGMVNISEETYKLVKNSIYCAYRGEIPAKNKGNVAMYFAIEKW